MKNCGYVGKVTHGRFLSGRSLVELMIAISISLLILTALIALFEANRQNYRLTDDKTRLDEEGRLALNLIAFHLRMAGYGELTTAKPVNMSNTPYTNFMSGSQSANYSTSKKLEAVQGCSGGFVSPGDVSPTCKNSGAGDGIIIRYVVAANNAKVSSASSPTDCLGQKIIGSPAIVDNRFYVATNAGSSTPELYCAGNGGTPSGAVTFVAPPQPIAENVTDMRITYGYDSDDDQSADRFLRADAITALPLPNWSRVVSAQICLVLRSANDGLTTKNQQYFDCKGDLRIATDRRLYSIFSSVVTIRSRASGESL